MILKKLILNDFLPFRGKQELDLSPGAGRPVVLVFADNMRGKTSILNAVRWAFYGKAFWHTNRPIGVLDLLNREAREQNQFDYSVAVEFIVGEDEYRIVRRATPRNLVASPQRDADYQVQISMTKNGFTLTSDQIEHEIHQVAPEQISRFFLFDGELLDQYEALLVQGSDQGRLIRDSIERVLGVPALIRARDDLRLLERKAIREHDRDEQHAKGVEKQEKRLNELLDDADKKDEAIAAYDKQLGELDGKTAQLESDLEGAERALKEQGLLEATDRSIAEVKDRIGATNDQLRDLRGQLWEDVLAETLEPHVEELGREVSGLTAAAQTRESLTQLVSELEEHLRTGSCPTCGQTLVSAARKQVEEQIKDAYGQLERVEDEPERLRKLYAQHLRLSQIKRNGSLKRVSDAQKSLREDIFRLVEHESQRDRLQEALEGQDTESMKIKRARLGALQSERRTAQQARSEAEVERNRSQREAAALRNAIEGNAVAGRMGLSRRRRLLYTTLFKLFEESVEALRSKLKSEVEEHATKAFLKMTTQTNYERLSINDSYGLTIVDRQKREVTLRSAGAEQVVALSLIDGLHKTGMGSGGVIMDTPFGRLDPRHRKNIVKYLASSSPQVVMLVHEGELTREQAIANMASDIARSYELKTAGVFATEIKKTALGVSM